MAESIKQRTNSLAAHRDGVAMQKLLSAMYADISTARSGLLYGSKTYDAASLADAAGATTTVSVPGAQMGDFVASVSFSLDLQGITVVGAVSNQDTVSVRLQNETGGAIDLASGTLRVIVLPKDSAASSQGMLRGAAVYNTASLVDAAGAETAINVAGAALGDYVLVSLGVDTQGMLVTGYVQSAGVVDVRIQNETGVTVDLASTTIRVRVLPEASFGAVSAISELAGHLKGSATYDVGAGGGLADGVGETTTVTVTGAVLGDFAVCALAADLLAITATAYVSAANTVSVRFQNESGGAANPGSVTLNARTIPASVFPLASPNQTSL